MKWIESSLKRSKILKDHYKLHDIDVFIKDKFTNHIDFDLCLKTIATMIPSELLAGVDIIYVGQFDFLIKRELNALYDQGAIYITNDQADEQDIIEDIVHETAHSLESRFSDMIYGDGRLMREFLGKRQRLYFLLKAENLKPLETLQTSFDFDPMIDHYLYKEVGYATMWSLITGLFITPYSVTDMREYFAVGFEHFVQGDMASVKSTCPVLYSKLENLFDPEE